MLRKKQIQKDTSVLIIKSEGGDIAVGPGALIDKRQDNFDTHTTNPTIKATKPTLRLFVIILLSVVVSTITGLISNIIASYLQETFNLIEDPNKMLLVTSIFILSLIISIFLQMQREK